MSYWEEIQTFGNGTGEFDILVATNVAFGALEPVVLLKPSKQSLRKTEEMEV